MGNVKRWVFAIFTDVSPEEEAYLCTAEFNEDELPDGEISVGQLRIHRQVVKQLGNGRLAWYYDMLDEHDVKYRLEEPTDYDGEAYAEGDLESIGEESY